MQPKTLSVIDVEERDVVTFAFHNRLAPGETLLDADIGCDAFRGEDALPGEVLVGGAQVQGSNVLQAVRGRSAGVTYHLRCVVPTSADRTLTEAALLPCKRL